MAVAPQPRVFEIVALPQVRARALGTLFDEEIRHWRKELYWDYAPSVEMIRRHVEARSLSGYVALQRGEVAGYCFFVYEDDKGLLGDVYVLEAYRRERPYGGPAGIASLLIERALETLQESPTVRRIEVQVLPFGLEPLAPLFQAHDFRCFPRLFFYKPLEPQRASETPAAAEAASGVELRPWEDRFFEPLAELIVAAYAGHLDSQINDHYETVEGALRFLKNIVLFPGCGVFQPQCSFVAVPAGPAGEPLAPPLAGLAGAVLASQVARGVGHITQLCLRREWQGRGVGRQLMQAAMERLAARGHHGVSLTVTADNHPAVKLYRRLGFAVLKGFAAYARDLR
ncbi:MAG: GNAT family N-acetyltransferase [Candidatus Acidiferrales bacterium]